MLAGAKTGRGGCSGVASQWVELVIAQIDLLINTPLCPTLLPWVALFPLSAGCYWTFRQFTIYVTHLTSDRQATDKGVPCRTVTLQHCTFYTNSTLYCFQTLFSFCYDFVLFDFRVTDRRRNYDSCTESLSRFRADEAYTRNDKSIPNCIICVCWPWLSWTNTFVWILKVQFKFDLHNKSLFI